MNISQIGNIAPAPVPERKPSTTPKTPATAATAGTASAAKAASVESAEQVKQAQKPTPKQLAEAVKSINTVLQVRSPDLEFSVDADSERTIIKVVDKKTHEVIRQMPTEEALQIAKALEHLESLLIRDEA